MASIKLKEQINKDSLPIRMAHKCLTGWERDKSTTSLLTVRAKSHRMSKRLKVLKKETSGPRRNSSKRKSCLLKLVQVSRNVQNWPHYKRRNRKRSKNWNQSWIHGGQTQRQLRQRSYPTCLSSRTQTSQARTQPSSRWRTSSHHQLARVLTGRVTITVSHST